MGIALITLAELFEPLHAMASRWMPARRSRSSDIRYVAVRPGCSVRPGHTLADPKVSAPGLPLRVVRLVDRQTPGSGHGRVVITGRIGDVCAELDRLVALESRCARAPGSRLH